ncbi:MAG: hypothetical protein AABX88_00155 [Nanoarchaeota archaeon]
MKKQDRVLKIEKFDALKKVCKHNEYNICSKISDTAKKISVSCYKYNCPYWKQTLYLY